jgi:hypothetical protein
MNDTDLDFDMYLTAMRKPCLRCQETFEGASWSGRCSACHNDLLVPYTSGEDYIGIGREVSE